MAPLRLTRRAMLGSVAALSVGGAAFAAGPDATMLPGTPLLPLGAFDPAAVKYVVEEFVISGKATAYKALGLPDAEARWAAAAVAGSAGYVTRIVVIRPADARNFNGSVLVEWLNVSGGLDVGPVWLIARRELVRSGWAYVGVSAQKIGIEGGKTIFGVAGKGLKQLDPKRYGSLDHPGDAFAYDIFSQAGNLVKGESGSAVLGGLKVRHVVGAGESQSAAFLTTYVNAVDPVARVYDGFLIYSRFGLAATLDGAPSAMLQPQNFQKMRSDLRAPVLVFETETDLLGPIGFYLARQPDTDRLRIWELAGASHVDAYMFKVSEIDSGTASYADLAAGYAPSEILRGSRLVKPYNNGPQNHYVVEAAVAQLGRWVATGQAPPHAQRIDMVAADQPYFPAFPMLDANGIVLGGIRTPWVDVPTSTLAGYGNSGTPQAFITGSAEPFDAAKLGQLYPGGKAEYLRRFEASLDKTIAAGFILAADRPEILGVAALSYGLPIAAK